MCDTAAVKFLSLETGIEYVPALRRGEVGQDAVGDGLGQRVEARFLGGRKTSQGRSPGRGRVKQKRPACDGAWAKGVRCYSR